MQNSKLSSSANRLLLACSIAALLMAVEARAQNRPDGRGRGGPFGGGGAVELLQRADVQAELELLDEQKEAARELLGKSNERRREVFGGFAEQFRNRDASEDQRRALQEQVREAMQKLNAETEASLDFLLPHQRKRLAQLEIQFRMRGAGGALGSREVSEGLALTDEQKEAVREKSRELAQEFAKKMAELRLQMQEQLLAELNPEQRAKFQELVGDPFEFQDRPPGAGGPRGPRGNGERR